MVVKGFVDMIDPSKSANARVQVEVTAIHPDGSYDFIGELCGGRNATIPFYDVNDNLIIPATE